MTKESFIKNIKVTKESYILQKIINYSSIIKFWLRFLFHQLAFCFVFFKQPTPLCIIIKYLKINRKRKNMQRGGQKKKQREKQRSRFSGVLLQLVVSATDQSYVHICSIYLLYFFIKETISVNFVSLALTELSIIYGF